MSSKDDYVQNDLVKPISFVKLGQIEGCIINLKMNNWNNNGGVRRLEYTKQMSLGVECVQVEWSKQKKLILTSLK